MKQTNAKHILSVLVGIVLIAALALMMTGCTGNTPATPPDTADTTGTAISTDPTEVGQGNTSFLFTVTDGEGETTAYTVHTDKTVVGEALEALGLLAGEEGQYGLYVKTVNGITVDFDTDSRYWAFYVDGQYAPTGVDVTPIEVGKTYAFKVEK